MPRHIHRAQKGKTKTRCYQYCVTEGYCDAHPEHKRAHGGVEHADYCRCGAVRFTEASGGFINHGPWHTAEREE